MDLMIQAIILLLGIVISNDKWNDFVTSYEDRIIPVCDRLLLRVMKVIT